MKKILFVINTLGTAGAETALMELLGRLVREEVQISLYVLTGQGEMVHKLPEGVRLLNRHYSELPLFSRAGKFRLWRTSFLAFFRNGHFMKKAAYTAKNLLVMWKNGQILPDKLLWRVLSDGGERFDEAYDLAVAFLEGGATYYVAEHVKAAVKAAFVHIDYSAAGYSRMVDKDFYEKTDLILPISETVKESFCRIYPEYAGKTAVFHNFLDRERICRLSREEGGFSDEYGGARLLTVGKLTWQKGYDIALETLSILKKRGKDVRWYVLGEGGQRRALEKKRKALGLTEDFLMPGLAENPYPYFAQSDIYVHATRYEGKSIALEEAKLLGCAIVASDHGGNRELVEDGKDGLLCALEPEAAADSIQRLLEDEELRRRLKETAAQEEAACGEEVQILLSLAQGKGIYGKGTADCHSGI